MCKPIYHILQAGTPRDLTAIITYDGPYHITWLPPYPPTGYVTQYKLRWKEGIGTTNRISRNLYTYCMFFFAAESTVWSDSAPFLPTSDVCSDVSYAKEGIGTIHEFSRNLS